MKYLVDIVFISFGRRVVSVSPEPPSLFSPICPISMSYKAIVLRQLTIIPTVYPSYASRFLITPSCLLAAILILEIAAGTAIGRINPRAWFRGMHWNGTDHGLSKRRRQGGHGTLKSHLGSITSHTFICQLGGCPIFSFTVWWFLIAWSYVQATMKVYRAV